jgi:acyl-coenzyme A synthetase/AMP-(fatty) acid ligase
MNTVLRLCNRFGALNAQYQRNKSLNAVRFESQNIVWDHEEANFQTQALAKGLSSLNFQKGDNFLLRVSSAQQAEAYITKLGTAAIGANVILSRGKTESEIGDEIKSNNIKGIVFEPTLPVG